MFVNGIITFLGDWNLYRSMHRKLQRHKTVTWNYSLKTEQSHWEWFIS